MAGAGGIEPTNAGSKNRCLTTWLRPNKKFSKKLIGNELEHFFKCRTILIARNSRYGKHSPMFFIF